MPIYTRILSNGKSQQFEQDPNEFWDHGIVCNFLGVELRQLKTLHAFLDLDPEQFEAACNILSNDRRVLEFVRDVLRKDDKQIENVRDLLNLSTSEFTTVSNSLRLLPEQLQFFLDREFSFKHQRERSFFQRSYRLLQEDRIRNAFAEDMVTALIAGDEQAINHIVPFSEKIALQALLSTVGNETSSIREFCKRPLIVQYFLVSYLGLAGQYLPPIKLNNSILSMAEIFDISLRIFELDGEEGLSLKHEYQGSGSLVSRDLLDTGSAYGLTSLRESVRDLFSDDDPASEISSSLQRETQERSLEKWFNELTLAAIYPDVLVDEETFKTNKWEPGKLYVSLSTKEGPLTYKFISEEDLMVLKEGEMSFKEFGCSEEELKISELKLYLPQILNVLSDRKQLNKETFQRYLGSDFSMLRRLIPARLHQQLSHDVYQKLLLLKPKIKLAQSVLKVNGAIFQGPQSETEKRRTALSLELAKLEFDMLRNLSRFMQEEISEFFPNEKNLNTRKNIFEKHLTEIKTHWLSHQIFEEATSTLSESVLTFATYLSREANAISYLPNSVKWQYGAPIQMLEGCLLHVVSKTPQNGRLYPEYRNSYVFVRKSKAIDSCLYFVLSDGGISPVGLSNIAKFYHAITPLIPRGQTQIALSFDQIQILIMANTKKGERVPASEHLSQRINEHLMEKLRALTEKPASEGFYIWVKYFPSERPSSIYLPSKQASLPSCQVRETLYYHSETGQTYNIGLEDIENFELKLTQSLEGRATGFLSPELLEEHLQASSEGVIHFLVQVLKAYKEALKSELLTHFILPGLAERIRHALLVAKRHPNLISPEVQAEIDLEVEKALAEFRNNFRCVKDRLLALYQNCLKNSVKGLTKENEEGLISKFDALLNEAFVKKDHEQFSMDYKRALKERYFFLIVKVKAAHENHRDMLQVTTRQDLIIHCNQLKIQINEEVMVDLGSVHQSFSQLPDLRGSFHPFQQRIQSICQNDFINLPQDLENLIKDSGRQIPLEFQISVANSWALLLARHFLPSQDMYALSDKMLDVVMKSQGMEDPLIQNSISEKLKEFQTVFEAKTKAFRQAFGDEFQPGFEAIFLRLQDDLTLFLKNRYLSLFGVYQQALESDIFVNQRISEESHNFLDLSYACAQKTLSSLQHLYGAIESSIQLGMEDLVEHSQETKRKNDLIDYLMENHEDVRYDDINMPTCIKNLLDNKAALMNFLDHHVSGASENLRNEIGHSLIHIALDLRDYSAFMLLLRSGFSPEESDASGKTPYAITNSPSHTGMRLEFAAWRALKVAIKEKLGDCFALKERFDQLWGDKSNYLEQMPYSIKLEEVDHILDRLDRMILDLFRCYSVTFCAKPSKSELAILKFPTYLRIRSEENSAKAKSSPDEETAASSPSSLGMRSLRLNAEIQLPTSSEDSKITLAPHVSKASRLDRSRGQDALYYYTSPGSFKKIRMSVDALEEFDRIVWEKKSEAQRGTSSQSSSNSHSSKSKSQQSPSKVSMPLQPEVVSKITAKQGTLSWAQLYDIAILRSQVSEYTERKEAFQKLMLFRLDLASVRRQGLYFSGHEEGMRMVLQQVHQGITTLPKLKALKRARSEVGPFIQGRLQAKTEIVGQNSLAFMKLLNQISDEYIHSEKGYLAEQSVLIRDSEDRYSKAVRPAQLHTGSQGIFSNLALSSQKFRDYFIQTVPSDGNCLFHAVADQLNQLNILDVHAQAYTHELLRNLVVSQVNHYPELRAFFTDESLTELSQINGWVGHETIQVLANLLNLTIVVMRNDGPEDCTIAPQAGIPLAGEIYILFSGSHYDSLRRVAPLMEEFLKPSN